MADALVEHGTRTGPVRFFCHRCSLEFEDALQEYICPYCSGGFIEELAAESSTAGTTDMDTDSSDNVEDDPDPFVNDLAFLMSGGRLRDMLGGAETLVQQIVWALAGGGEVRTAGAPLVFVGAPGDYVLGGEGLDAVVTQLLGQLEGSGPPPMPRELIDTIQSVAVTSEQVAARLQCSVCWDHFTLDEQVSQLSCTHVFHAACIEPWLQLHATCPICRHCLLPSEAEGEESQVYMPVMGRTTAPRLNSLLQMARRQNPLLRAATPSTPSTSSSSSSSSASWGPPASHNLDSSPSSDQASRQGSQYNMDLDYD